MDSKTLEALNGSIKKWEKIVEGTGEDTGVENCPLCQKFYWDLNCVGCPIYEKTGLTECSGSPYDEWRDIIDCDDYWCLIPKTIKESDNDIQKRKMTSAAKKMLKFLKSLLPKEKNERAKKGPGKSPARKSDKKAKPSKR